ncbi:hypothetical protein WB334_24805, partial [Escherichia coli]|uniref:hypothetical protein n=1 Tax=Escherichia coli TaxID=562 RepID=UPI0021575060
TIDYAQSRKIKNSDLAVAGLVVELSPKLDMIAAINNEMDKGGGQYNTVSIDARFRKQIRIVMECTTNKAATALDKEVGKLLTLSKQMGNIASVIAGLLIAAQAYFAIKKKSESKQYAEEAIVQAEKAMKENDPAGYPTWKACMMLKGAVLMGEKERHTAI